MSLIKQWAQTNKQKQKIFHMARLMSQAQATTAAKAITTTKFTTTKFTMTNFTMNVLFGLFAAVSLASGL